MRKVLSFFIKSGARGIDFFILGNFPKSWTSNSNFSNVPLFPIFPATKQKVKITAPNSNDKMWKNHRHCHPTKKKFKIYRGIESLQRRLKKFSREKKTRWSVWRNLWGELIRSIEKPRRNRRWSFEIAVAGKREKRKENGS